MTTLRQVAEALEAKLETIPGLRSESHVPGTASRFPFAFVTPPPIEYETLALSALDALPFGIVVLVSETVPRNQLDLLDYQDVTGTRSIPALIQADRTLGLTGVDAFVLASRPLVAEEIAGYQAFGIVFDVPVRIS